MLVQNISSRLDFNNDNILDKEICEIFSNNVPFVENSNFYLLLDLQPHPSKLSNQRILINLLQDSIFYYRIILFKKSCKYFVRHLELSSISSGCSWFLLSAPSSSSIRLVRVQSSGAFVRVIGLVRV